MTRSSRKMMMLVEWFFFFIFFPSVIYQQASDDEDGWWTISVDIFICLLAHLLLPVYYCPALWGLSSHRQLILSLACFYIFSFVYKALAHSLSIFSGSICTLVLFTWWLCKGKCIQQFATSLTATGTHITYVRYLPPGRGDIPAFTPPTYGCCYSI